MITSLPAATSADAGSAFFERWMYASSRRTIASFGLLATRYSMSSLRGDRAGRVVRIADVDQPGVGVGLRHRVDIVGIVFPQAEPKSPWHR